MRIDDFLHFGYVGAPWKRDWEFRGVAPIKVGNGGLSLRQRSADFATLVGMRDARMKQHTNQARPLEMRRDSLLRQHQHRTAPPLWHTTYRSGETVPPLATAATE